MDFDSNVPLYHQMLVILRDRIMSGRISAGDLLQGDIELAKEFGVSRITSRRALDELSKEGLIVRQRGKRTVVTHSPIQSSLTTSVHDWLQGMSILGQTTTVKLLSLEYTPGSPETLQNLELPPGSVVQCAERVRYRNGIPISYLKTWLPEKIGRSFTAKDLETEAMLSLLEKSGVKIASARQIISASLADTAVANWLKIHAGSALIDVRRTLYDVRKTPAQLIHAFYRPDQYQLEVVLTRDEKAGSSDWTTFSTNPLFKPQTPKKSKS